MKNKNLNIKSHTIKNKKIEWTLEGNIKSPSSEDKCELICFKTYLFDNFEFIVIMNIPENGKDNAPCYVKIKNSISGQEYQFKKNAFIKENNVGGEILHFSFELFGIMDLIIIANVPFEDQIKAPVYLKITPKGER